MDHYDWLAHQDMLREQDKKSEVANLEEKISSKEALECLIEELFMSKENIDADYIACYLRVLADEYGIRESSLIDPKNLCVEHFRAKWKVIDAIRHQYEPRLKRIKESFVLLKDELCGMGQIQTEKAQQSFNDICAELCIEKDKISVRRKETMEFYDFMFGRQLPRATIGE